MTIQVSWVWEAPRAAAMSGSATASEAFAPLTSASARHMRTSSAASRGAEGPASGWEPERARHGVPRGVGVSEDVGAETEVVIKVSPGQQWTAAAAAVRAVAGAAAAPLAVVGGGVLDQKASRAANVAAGRSK